MSLNESSYEHVEVTDSLMETHPIKSTNVTNTALERLLLEAQKESNKSSRISSIVGSPKLETGTASPTLSNEMNQPGVPDMEWVWNWSSRPEAHPLSMDRTAFKHPIKRKHKFSIRNTQLMKKISVVMEVFPYIVLSHTFSFLFGASVVALYLKKVNNEPVVSVE